MIGVQVPLSPQTFFFFFSFNFAKNQVLFIEKNQNLTQKLFVQFHFFKHFLCAFITYDKKMESKVLGNLLLITINFLTVWAVKAYKLLWKVMSLWVFWNLLMKWKLGSFSVIFNSVSCCLTVEGRDNDKRRVSRSVCCPNAFLVLWRRFSACFFVKKREKKSVTSTLTILHFQQTTFQSNYLFTCHFSLKYSIRKGFARITLKTGWF